MAYPLYDTVPSQHLELNETSKECNGASLEILDQKIDTGTASGKAFLKMLGVLAEFETNLHRERQMADIFSEENSLVSILNGLSDSKLTVWGPQRLLVN